MAIAQVQDIGTQLTVGGSTTKTIAISAPASGSMLTLFIVRPNASSISSVSGGGVTWSSVGSVSDGIATIELWMGPNSSGSGTTISIVVSNSYSSYETHFGEWSGIDASPVADPANSTNTGTSTTASTSSVTPTAGKEVVLIAAGFSTNDLADSPTGSFTALTRSGTAGGGIGAGNSVFAYRIVGSASGSYSTSWTGSAGYRAWATIIAGWDAAAGGGGFIDNTSAILRCLWNAGTPC